MTKQISYIMGIQVHEDGFKQPVKSTKDVDETFVKVYGGTTEKIASIQGCPRNLIEFLTRKMNDKNIAHVSVVEKEEFRNEIKEATNGEVDYSKIVIDKALAKLKENNLLFTVHRGIVMVNPEYYFKGNSERRRLSMIKENLEKGLGR